MSLHDFNPPDHHTNIFHKNYQLTAKTLDTQCYALITTVDHAPQPLSTRPETSLNSNETEKATLSCHPNYVSAPITPTLLAPLDPRPPPARPIPLATHAATDSSRVRSSSAPNPPPPSKNSSTSPSPAGRR